MVRNILRKFAQLSQARWLGLGGISFTALPKPAYACAGFGYLSRQEHLVLLAAGMIKSYAFEVGLTASAAGLAILILPRIYRHYVADAPSSNAPGRRRKSGPVPLTTIAGIFLACLGLPLLFASFLDIQGMMGCAANRY